MTLKDKKYSIFIIAGQSNAQGAYDDEGRDPGCSKEACEKLPEGLSYYVDSRRESEANAPKLCDLSDGRSGFSTAFAKRWYELTGERTIMVIGAANGSPIQCWQKNGDRYYKGVGNCYSNTRKGYDFVCRELASAGAEITRTGLLWCQGETTMIWQWITARDGETDGHWENENPVLQSTREYYDYFIAMYENFKKDLGVEFCAINLARSLIPTTRLKKDVIGLYTELVPIRAAQYALHNNSDESIFIASRLCDIARNLSYTAYKNEPGYGYIGSQETHYRQPGYNAIGIELAENTYIRLFGHKKASSYEIISSNGHDRLFDGETIKLLPGSNYQLVALPLQLASMYLPVGYEISSGGESFMVDKYGKIFVTEDAKPEAAGEITIYIGKWLCRLKLVINKADTANEKKTIAEAQDRFSADSAWNFDLS